MAHTSSRGSWRWWILMLVLATLTLFEPLSVHAARGAATRYIVALKVSAGDPGAVAARDSGRYGAQVTHVYRLAFKGFAATIPSDRIAVLRADPEVRFLSPMVRSRRPARRSAQA
jgi:Peptidase inhibitor I9